MRTFAYISQEVGEVVPAVAHLDATSAVAFVAWVVWVVATLNHVSPRFVEWVYGSLTVAMSKAFCATARAIFTATQIICSSGARIAAVALAQPKYFVVVVCSQWTNGNQQAKSFVCDITSVGHRAASTVRGQVAGSVLKHRPRCAW